MYKTLINETTQRLNKQFAKNIRLSDTTITIKNGCPWVYSFIKDRYVLTHPLTDLFTLLSYLHQNEEDATIMKEYMPFLNENPLLAVAQERIKHLFFNRGVLQQWDSSKNGTLTMKFRNKEKAEKFVSMIQRAA